MAVAVSDGVTLSSKHIKRGAQSASFYVRLLPFTFICFDAAIFQNQQLNYGTFE